MKQLAILEYEILFDPIETWSSGYQFENMFADFFAAHGYEAQIIESRGGTGKRVIFIDRVNEFKQISKNIPQPKESKPATEQIKETQSRTPSKGFKQYFERGVPKSIVNQDKKQPKLSFPTLGRSNRQKIKYG